MMTHMNNKGVIDKEWGDLRVNMSNKWDVSSDVNNKGVVSRMMDDMYPTKNGEIAVLLTTHPGCIVKYVSQKMEWVQ